MTRMLRNRAGSTTTGHPPWQVEMNTTPLIDVLLVLLVMLILTVPAITHQTTLETPARSSASAAQPTPVRLDIDFDGRLWWNGIEVDTLSALQDRFAALMAASGPQAPVQVHADRRARYGRVAQVLASAQRNRVTRLGLAPLPD